MSSFKITCSATDCVLHKGIVVGDILTAETTAHYHELRLTDAGNHFCEVVEESNPVQPSMNPTTGVGRDR